MVITRQIRILASLLFLFILTGCESGNQSGKDINMETIEETNTFIIDYASQTTGTDSIAESYSKTGAWSPDKKWVAVTYTARTWIDTLILDVGKNKEYRTDIYEYITSNADKYSYKIGENQMPEPYVNFLEWSPDSNKVLLSYLFFDDDNIRQSGIAIYNPAQRSVEWIMKMAPIKDKNAEIKKPDGFKWESIGYGLEDGIAS